MTPCQINVMFLLKVILNKVYSYFENIAIGLFYGLANIKIKLMIFGCELGLRLSIIIILINAL